MNRKDAPEEAKVYLDILDHYYVGKCPCKDLVDGEKVNEVIQYCRDVYDIFYTPDDAEVKKDWKAESDKWETMYRTVAAQLDRTSATLYSTCRKRKGPIFIRTMMTVRFKMTRSRRLSGRHGMRLSGR